MKLTKGNVIYTKRSNRVFPRFIQSKVLCEDSWVEEVVALSQQCQGENLASFRGRMSAIGGEPKLTGAVCEFVEQKYFTMNEQEISPEKRQEVLIWAKSLRWQFEKLSDFRKEAVLVGEQQFSSDLTGLYRDYEPLRQIVDVKDFDVDSLLSQFNYAQLVNLIYLCEKIYFLIDDKATAALKGPQRPQEATLFCSKNSKLKFFQLLEQVDKLRVMNHWAIWGELTLNNKKYQLHFDATKYRKIPGVLNNR